MGIRGQASRLGFTVRLINTGTGWLINQSGCMGIADLALYLHFTRLINPRRIRQLINIDAWESNDKHAPHIMCWN